MSTKVVEADREVARDVFRLRLPARGGGGAKAKDERLGPKALDYFAVHNITRRAGPERFGRWKSVLGTFHLLSRAGVFEDLFATLLELSRIAHLVEMFDSTVIRARVIAAAGAKGRQHGGGWTGRRCGRQVCGSRSRLGAGNPASASVARTRCVAERGSDVSPTSPTQREFCRFSLFSATQVIELLNPCTPNSPQYRL